MSATDHDEPSFLLDLMHEAADAAGAAILPFFRAELTIEHKAGDRPFDPVTAGDRAGEQAIRALLSRKAPFHAVFGEEFGGQATLAHSPYRWVIDPIDGTRGFILGLPTWGTLIALEKDGVPIMGLMDQPYVGDRFFSDGSAAWHRRPGEAPRRLRTRATTDLAAAHLAATSPDIFSDAHEHAVFETMRTRVRDTRFGTDCYAYCLLAAGLIDIVVEAGLKPYDVAALVPVIEHAGGHITTWTGEPAHAGGRIIAASNDHLHRAALDLIASCPAD
jgi:myo-inositol-1(or 4)-monophosphatase